MGRKTVAEVEARRSDVYEMLMQGKPKSHIVSYCATNWGVRLSAVEHDIAAVRQDLEKAFLQEKKDIIATHVARYENLYRFYMDEGTEEDLNVHYNPETAAKMLEKKEKLLQLHNPNVVVENMQVVENQQNINFSNLSVEEIKNLLNKE